MSFGGKLLSLFAYTYFAVITPGALELTMTASAKYLVGFDIRRRRPAAPARDSMPGGLAQLAGIGFQPRTVIDAGVANATPEQRRTQDREFNAYLGKQRKELR
jgi:hypothetical protein